MIFCERLVCAKSHLAVIGGSNMRGAHYQLSVGTFSPVLPSPPSTFFRGIMAMPAATFSKLRKFFFSTSRIFPSVLSQELFSAYVCTVCRERYLACLL